MAIFIPVYQKHDSSKRQFLCNYVGLRHVMFPYTTPFHVAIVMCTRDGS